MLNPQMKQQLDPAIQHNLLLDLCSIKMAWLAKFFFETYLLFNACKQFSSPTLKLELAPSPD